MNNNPIMNGNVYEHAIDGWRVSWESSGQHRHWCRQVKDESWKTLLVVMFNPGSLSGGGVGLSKDLTLRILREVTGGAELNSFVINLYDYADPKVQNLFNNWSLRDGSHLIYDYLNLKDFCGFIMAYGDYQNWGQQNESIKERILLVKKSLSELKQIDLKPNSSGTPKHPVTWQRQKYKPEFIRILKNKTE